MTTEYIRSLQESIHNLDTLMCKLKKKEDIRRMTMNNIAAAIEEKQRELNCYQEFEAELDRFENELWRELLDKI